MIALFNELPKFCPNCGKNNGKWSDDGRQDFFAGASHTCQDCGLHYAYVEGPKLLAVAAETGDIGRYVMADDVR